MTERRCRKCGRRLPRAEGPGRPPRWCSTGCRRSAEYAVKRLNRRIERLEVRLDDDRGPPNEKDAFGMGIGPKRSERHEETRATIRELEARLAELLEDE